MMTMLDCFDKFFLDLFSQKNAPGFYCSYFRFSLEVLAGGFLVVVVEELRDYCLLQYFQFG